MPPDSAEGQLAVDRGDIGPVQHGLGKCCPSRADGRSDSGNYCAQQILVLLCFPPSRPIGYSIRGAGR